MSTAFDVADVARAEELVVRDVRRGYPELTHEEALEQALDAVALRRVRGDDETAEAYRTVLAYRTEPTRRELVALVGELARVGVARLTTQQRVWALRAERGELR